MQESMLLLKELKTEVVKSNPIAIRKRNGTPAATFSLNEIQFHSIDELEIVHGERFVKDDGEEIIIGMTSDVREKIGIPFGIFQKQQGKIENLTQKLEELRKTIRWLRRKCQRKEQQQDSMAKKLASLTTWQRLKILLGTDPNKLINNTKTPQ